MTTAITNVRLFDGHDFHPTPKTVVITDTTIAGIYDNNNQTPKDATIVDGKGQTLLPGLIDAHTHTKIPQLEIALKFGVTTELEMMGHWTPAQREEVASRDDIADLRTAEFGLTMPGGHPSELHKHVRGPGSGRPPPGTTAAGGPPPLGAHSHGPPPGFGRAPTASTPAEATQFVADRVADGADYVKIMIEEGSVLEAPGLPTMTRETMEAAVKAAHEHKKIAIAHALTRDATRQALAIGVDGLAHLYIDTPTEEGPDTALIAAIAKSGAFVTPCLCLNASIMGQSPTFLVDNPLISSKLDKPWLDTLAGKFNTYPTGSVPVMLETVKKLHDAGVAVLVGTDASMPVPALGGVAHGVSVHHELQLLMEAGFTVEESLRAATSVPAKCFSLGDRGVIEAGKRADLLLVGGDVAKDVSATLDVKGVWRRGTRLAM